MLEGLPGRRHDLPRGPATLDGRLERQGGTGGVPGESLASEWISLFDHDGGVHLYTQVSPEPGLVSVGSSVHGVCDDGRLAEPAELFECLGLPRVLE